MKKFIIIAILLFSVQSAFPQVQKDSFSVFTDSIGNNYLYTKLYMSTPSDHIRRVNLDPYLTSDYALGIYVLSCSGFLVVTPKVTIFPLGSKPEVGSCLYVITALDSNTVVPNCDHDSAIYYLDTLLIACNYIQNIDPPKKKEQLTVAPNPSKSSIKIHGDKELGELMIYDIYGWQVHHTTSKEVELVIDISGYSSGLYIIRSQNNNVLTSVTFLKE